ncbi:hypothetical protein C0Q70_03165 [Pomacea canaliculata]|uniref:Uncharacterized protein n=1 Tax=Pomacea canaliculata TaxID=400727 RepID=A0A2T7PS19_POMCA|nr:hypothetical protein C0Q70_03165 [Pomacea canaliculata]
MPAMGTVPTGPAGNIICTAPPETSVGDNPALRLRTSRQYQAGYDPCVTKDTAAEDSRRPRDGERHLANDRLHI